MVLVLLGSHEFEPPLFNFHGCSIFSCLEVQKRSICICLFVLPRVGMRLYVRQDVKKHDSYINIETKSYKLKFLGKLLI